MKKTRMIFATIAAVMMALPTFAMGEQKDPPKVVNDAFAKMYPQAQEVEWEAAGGDLWSVEFEVDDTEYEADFKSNGSWLETEHEIGVASVPAEVSKRLEPFLKGERVDEVDMVESPEGVSYEFSLSDNREITISADGQVLKEAMDDDDMEDDWEDD